ncbi:MAG: putative iron-regulated membrane protein, partial [Flavobacteriales bacterium]
YSGKVVAAYNWNDVGILMEIRQVFMRLHQGEYGLINWLVMLGVGLAFIVMTCAGLTSYLIRKSKGSWSIPQVPVHFNVDKTLILMIILLGLLFPMFGGSLVLLWLWEKRHRLTKRVNKLN